jgi:hypothetical protein
MKIFATTLEIQPVAPILGQNVGDEPQCSAVGLEIKLLRSSLREFDLVFDTPAEAMAAIAAVERFICRAARTNSPLHLLPL